MTILVDEARWPWRGTHWCHLVSDSDLAELHRFAAGLGSRRVGFQGDHYDIDTVTRTLALERGAEACTSRDLVRRLRAAGLRLRPSSFTKWSLLDRWEPPIGADDLAGMAPIVIGPHTDRALDSLNGTPLDGAFALSRGSARALVLFGVGAAPPVDEDSDRGLHVRTDVHGRWSLELVSPPLADHE